MVNPPLGDPGLSREWSSRRGLVRHLHASRPILGGVHISFVNLISGCMSYLLISQTRRYLPINQTMYGMSNSYFTHIVVVVVVVVVCLVVGLVVVVVVVTCCCRQCRCCGACWRCCSYSTCVSGVGSVF